jgi:hypothetical protein
VVPADQLIEEVAAVSGPLKKYRVRVVRTGFETVMKLSDADAARLVSGGTYELSDAVSTIEPVTAVGDDTGGDDSGDPASPAAAMADAGAVVSENMATGLTETEPVQPPTTPGDDGQATENQAAQAGTPGDDQTETPVVAAPETKPTRKRASSSANKARTSAANKADGGS